jgi:hypothetical protein
MTHGQADEVVVTLALWRRPGPQRRDELGEEPSIPKNRSGSAGFRMGRTALSAGPAPPSAFGLPSPSQVAVPSRPTACQDPVQLVGKPGADQLESKANQTPPVISKIALAAGRPRDQLPGGS